MYETSSVIRTLLRIVVVDRLRDRILFKLDDLLEKGNGIFIPSR